MTVHRDFPVVKTVGIPVEVVPLTFAGTTSPAVEVQGRFITGIDIPADFDGTALTLLNMTDGTNYRAVKDGDKAAISFTVEANEFLKFDPPLAGYSSLKFVSNASEDVTIRVSLLA